MMKKVVSAVYVAVVVCSVAVVMVAGAGGGGGKGGGEDEGTTLAVFSGVHGLNRASVCVLNVRPVRRCEAALATARWAVVRASCLLGATATSLRLVRDSDGLSCADVEIGTSSSRQRAARSATLEYWGMRVILTMSVGTYRSKHVEG